MSSKSTHGEFTPLSDSKFVDSIMKSLEVVSVKDVRRIALIDAERVSTAPNDYAANNKYTYYTIINLWLFVASAVSESGSLELHEAISKQGLLQTIADCDKAANAIIGSFAGCDVDGVSPYLTNLLSAAKDDRTALQLLRFPKRFSPDGADLVQQESIDGLLAINNRCKSINRAGYCGWATFKSSFASSSPSYYWVSRIRERIAEILKGYDADLTDGVFSTGVAADADRPLADKLQAYASWCPNLYGSALYPISHKRDGESDEFRSPQYCARVLAVPKSYKAARIIAEEHVYRQYGMQAIRREIERCIAENGYKDYLDLHSQLRNQQYANLGSRFGVYATIDLSSASDSVARSLAYNVLPNNLVRDLDKFLPRTFSVDGTTRVMHMFCTSGSAVTFPVESIIFLAIALEVREVVQALTGELFLPPCVFGDDIVTDTCLFDTTTDVLEQLGFTVNPTKSFGPGTAYRESCGTEYVCGYDLQSDYWPRAVLRWDARSLPATIAQLCSLEHKLYGNYVARKFLIHLVRCLEPRMTSHTAGVECDDLWETIPVFRVTHAPGLRDCTDAGALRHRHLTLKTRHQDRRLMIGSSGFTNQELVEMWRYSTFLRSGPRYDDELQMLLGVSSKPTPVAYDCDRGSLHWSYTTE